MRAAVRERHAWGRQRMCPPPLPHVLGAARERNTQTDRQRGAGSEVRLRMRVDADDGVTTRTDAE
jgi:hypothetical protein